jgi:hypothetical protein
VLLSSHIDHPFQMPNILHMSSMNAVEGGFVSDRTCTSLGCFVLDMPWHAPFVTCTSGVDVALLKKLESKVASLVRHPVTLLSRHYNAFPC